MISALPTISQAVEQIHRGTLTPLELLEFCLDRIRRFGSQVRAWVQIDEIGAWREAERLGQLARSGTIVGPLHGIPVGIKDIIDIAAWPTRAGSRLRENHVATRDAPVVAALRAAGAIILGKTVTTEFACFDPPPTRNPWNLQHTPGGSSSGSAAAVSLGMCVAAIGSQTGGSIIRPASFCGVVGLKPTHGAVSGEGVVPISRYLDHVGPITNCVADARDMFRAIQSGSDLATNVAELPELWVLDGFFRDEASPDVREVTARAVEQMLADWPQDASLVTPGPWPPASFGEVHAMHRRIMAVGAAAYHRDDFLRQRAAFGEKVASLIAEGLTISAVDYDAALQHQQRFRSEMDDALPEGWIAVMPATCTPAPGLNSTGDPKFNAPWSYSGAPAITIPCGLAANGLPCGLQLVGRPNSEPQLLRAAELCERRLHFSSRPKLLD